MKQLSIMIIFLLTLVNLNGIETLEPGKLKVGVTGICKEDKPHHNCWVYKILSAFAEENDLELDLQVITFDQSWALPAVDELDIAATGITPLPERKVEGASNSDYYSIVKRGLRIKVEDRDQFKTIDDFIGYKVGAVKGMTSELDLRRRAPQGVEIVTPDTWAELYRLFESGEIAATAEGFYVFSENENINNYDDKTLMIDAHDLHPDELEGNTFVVRDASCDLLEELNDFIQNRLDNGIDFP